MSDRQLCCEKVISCKIFLQVIRERGVLIDIIRIMRPGREHMVYTLEDTVVKGGHFFCYETMGYSFYAGFRERLHGRLSMNMSDLCSEVFLYQILKGFVGDFICAKDGGKAGE